MANWIDNADSYRCPVCGHETGNPNYHNCECPVCGFVADKDVLGNDYDLDRLRELAQADREGRAHILPSPRENTCGKCGNFTRTPGCGYGECTLRPGLRPYQSRAKCKRYTEKALE